MSVCFRCCELWLGVEGAAAPVEGARAFVDVILAKLSSFFRNRFAALPGLVLPVLVLVRVRVRVLVVCECR